MERFEQQYIERELEKRFPDIGDEDLYDTCYRIHAVLGNPLDWKLIEIIDAETLEQKWQWVKKS